MTKEIWLNLPVKDLEKSKEFFTKLGFSFDERFADSDESACLVIGDKNFVVMLFTEPTFEKFTDNKIVDPKDGTEVLFSIDVETREEVDKIAVAVVNAGGTIYSKAGARDNWMYGCGFADLDGHRWNVLYMDDSEMPKE